MVHLLQATQVIFGDEREQSRAVLVLKSARESVEKERGVKAIALTILGRKVGLSALCENLINMSLKCVLIYQAIL